MSTVVVTTLVAAPILRVWRALTEPGEVAAWDGALPVAVPEGYPVPGQHARWRVRVGPVGLTLHDRIREVDAPHRLAAELRLGPVRIEEEYRLRAVDGSTEVVSENRVSARARAPGLEWLLGRWLSGSANGAMDRLRVHCERG